MGNYDIQKFNIYTMLSINKESSKEDLYRAYERYKRLNVSDAVASKTILRLLEENFILLEEIGIEEYKKKINKPNSLEEDGKKRKKPGLLEFLDLLQPSDPKASATTDVINYEEEFMQKSDKVEFDKSKVRNVNDKRINIIGKKFIIKVIAGILAVVGAGSAAAWAANKEISPVYIDDSTPSISQGMSDEQYDDITYKEELYEFDYLVNHGDTVDGLYEKFKIEKVDKKSTDMLRAGDIWHIYTTDKDIAEEQQKLYDIKTAEPVMADWEDYTVKPGDTPISIAQKFNIDVNYLMKFNNTEFYSAIPDINTCYVGDTIKIPILILTGEDAYDYMQVKDNSMKAVG